MQSLELQANFVLLYILPEFVIGLRVMFDINVQMDIADLFMFLKPVTWSYKNGREVWHYKRVCYAT